MDTTSRVLITGKLHPSAIDSFKNNPAIDLVYLADCSREELLKEVKTAHVLVTRSETSVDKEVMDVAQNLKVVARAAVGVSNIDVKYATEKGILVINTPGKNTNSAAEMTLATLLSLIRHLPEANQTVKAGGWDRHRFSGHELKGMRLGIVGLGNVGHRVSRFAKSFEAEVFAYDPYISPEIFRRHGVIAVDSLLELAKKVDILSVHVPLNSETRSMINREVLEVFCNPSPVGRYLLNLARGGLIDEALLVEFLDNDALTGVGLDVFEAEPQGKTPLVEHPKVICTPHIGASTAQAQFAIGTTIYDQVIKALEGGVVDFPVNLPNVTVIDNPLVQSYSVLAEKLGAVAGQLLEFNPSHMELIYRGRIADVDHSLVRLGWMRGFAAQVVSDYVSFVNAPAHFEKLGIELVEIDESAFEGYRSAFKAIIYGAQGKTLSIGGVVFDDSVQRLSLINDFYFEVEPSGHLIFMRNEDKPGVIGDVGHFLAQHQVNIDSFDLSRNRRGEQAMAMIRVDTALATKDLIKLRKINNVISVHSVQL